EVPRQMEGHPVQFGAEVVLLIVAVEVAEPVAACAPGLPGSFRQAMSALDVAGPATFKREVSTISDVGQRVLQPGAPDLSLTRGEGIGDHRGGRPSLRDRSRQPRVRVVEGPRGGGKVKDCLAHRRAWQVPPRLRI